MALPFALQHAQDDLQRSIESAISAHAKGVPLQLDLSIEDERGPSTGPLSDASKPIEEAVRALVGSFHEDENVRQAGLRARHVTAFDSDGDGKGTVNVRYVYQQEATSSDPADAAADV